MMLGELTIPHRVGYDIDDTIVWREGATRLGGALKGRFSHYQEGHYRLNEIPNLDHTPVDKDWVKPGSFFFHMLRPAFPGISERLRRREAKGDEIIFVSGRPATTQWHLGTYNQLANYEIYPSKILLTPIEGPHGDSITNTQSKADVIRAFNIREFYDDDGRTILYLSEMFPNLSCNWIRHGVQNVTQYYQDMMRERKNVEIIPSEDWISKAA